MDQENYRPLKFDEQPQQNIIKRRSRINITSSTLKTSH